MRHILLILFAAWLLFGNGISAVQSWLTRPAVQAVPGTVATGLDRVLAPLPTAAAPTPIAPAGVVLASAPAAVVVPQPRPTTILPPPTPLPSVAPPIPLDKGEYTFLDRGSSVVARYCVQMPAQGVEICDPDVSMLSEVTQQFIARSIKLGTMQGTPIQ